MGPVDVEEYFWWKKYLSWLANKKKTKSKCIIQGTQHHLQDTNCKPSITQKIDMKENQRKERKTIGKMIGTVEDLREMGVKHRSRKTANTKISNKKIGNINLELLTLEYIDRHISNTRIIKKKIYYYYFGTFRNF